MTAVLRTLRDRLLGRRLAYRRLFLTEDGRPNPDASVVLADLKRFCRAEGTTLIVSPTSGQVDPLAMAHAEGRREVWIRLQQYLHLDDRIITNLTED